MAQQYTIMKMRKSDRQIAGYLTQAGRWAKCFWRVRLRTFDEEAGRLLCTAKADEDPEHYYLITIKQQS